MSPTLLYSQSEPQLEPGKIYAWRVTAKSALWAGLLFQNNGKSEVCSFTYTGSGGDPFDPFGGSGGGGTGGGNPFGGGSGNPFGGGVGSPSGVGGGGGGTFGSSGLAAEQKEEQRVPPSGCEVFDTDYGTVKGNGQAPIPLVEGDIVKLGYFSMVVNDATPSAEGVSGGTGSILAARSETQRIFMVRQALTKSRWSCRRRAATIFPSSSRCR